MNIITFRHINGTVRILLSDPPCKDLAMTGVQQNL